MSLVSTLQDNFPGKCPLLHKHPATWFGQICGEHPYPVSIKVGFLPLHTSPQLSLYGTDCVDCVQNGVKITCAEINRFLPL